MTAMRQHIDRAIATLSQRFAEVTELGQGRSGIVLAAKRRDAEGAAIALKVMYPKDAVLGLTEVGSRFHRECEIGNALRHPRILHTSLPQELDGITWYEMERAGPYRLDHVILATHPASFERIVAIMREVAEALDFAHAKGIVHGALRPTNVLLDPSGHVLVKDFMLRESEVSSIPALSPSAVGDAAYMPPEQWRDPMVDRRVDVYSAGVLAYELCTGQRRVSYDVPGVAEIRPLELPPNRALRDGIPLHVNAAIRKATSKEAPVRFASVGEFAEALAKPAAALGHSLPTYAPPMQRQRTSPIILLLLVLGASGLALLAPGTARNELVRWGRSVLHWGGREIDPLDIDVRPRAGGGDASRANTQAPPASRAGSTRADSSGRDSTSPAGAASNRDDSRRSNPAREASMRASQSGTRRETSRAPANDSSGPSENSPALVRGGAGTTRSDEGVIKVTLDQGRALVFVDGVPRGLSPAIVRVAPGPHRVRLRGTLRYDPTEMRLDVTRGDTAFAEFYATNAPLPDTTSRGDVLSRLAAAKNTSTPAPR